MTEKKTKAYVTNAETDQVSRALLVWLNQYEELPTTIKYEYLDKEAVSMALSTIQSAYKVAQYIDGTYAAEYQFKLIYRIFPTVKGDARLKADELLNAVGDWAVSRIPRPIIGANKVVTKMSCNTRSGLFAVYEDGAEDHQILMTMNYEVI